MARRKLGYYKVNYGKVGSGIVEAKSVGHAVALFLRAAKCPRPKTSSDGGWEGVSIQYLGTNKSLFGASA